MQGGIGGVPDGYSVWMAQDDQLYFGDSAAAGAARASRERWVPQMMYGGAGLAVAGTTAGSKRPRTASAAYSYW